MRLEISWSSVAIHALLSMPRRDAERVDAAVIRFAATGSGDVQRLPEDDASTRRLRVGGYRVRMVLNPFEPRLWIVTIYRADR